MSNVKKPRPIQVAKEPTEEEKKAAMARAYAQKRAALAEGVLFNLCNNPSMVSTAFTEPAKIADSAVKIAESFMEKLYNGGE